MQMTDHMWKQEAALPQARRVSGRLLLFIAAPVGWMVAAWLHPAPNADRIYEDLASAADRWLIVHLLQLVLTLGIGASLWIAVRGRQGIAATVTRLVVPVYLVFFAAFDSVAGIASGLGGVLLDLHAAGVIPIVGLVALSCSLCAADRRGLLAMRHPVA